MLNGRGMPLPEVLFTPLRALKRLSTQLTAVAAILCGMNATNAQAQTDTLQLTATYQNGISTPAVVNLTENKGIRFKLHPNVIGDVGSYNIMIKYMITGLPDTLVYNFPFTNNNIPSAPIDSNIRLYASYLEWGISQAPSNATASLTVFTDNIWNVAATEQPCTNGTNDCERICNGGFDNHNGCPIGGGELYRATNWFNQDIPDNYIYDNSPDFFNSCATNQTNHNFAIPNNWAGSQHTSDGDNSYVGIAGENHWLEGFRQILSSPLVAGRKYVASFKTSLAGQSKYASKPNWFGMEINMGGVTSVFIRPSTIITDTTNWTTVSGTFTANASTVGIRIAHNFFNSDQAIQIEHPNTSTNLYTKGAYYYIDDVHLTLVPENLIPAICGNGGIIGDANCFTSNMNITWTQTVDGVTTSLPYYTPQIEVYPPTTTTYTRKVVIDNQVFESSCTIFPSAVISNSTINVVNNNSSQSYEADEDVVVCAESTLGLSITNSTNVQGLTYSWAISDGNEAHPHLTVYGNGTQANLSFEVFDNQSYIPITVTATLMGGQTGCRQVITKKIIIIGNCCLVKSKEEQHPFILGSPVEGVEKSYTNSLPNSVNSQYLVVGNINLLASTNGGIFPITKQTIKVLGQAAYYSNNAEVLGGTVSGPKITAISISLKILGTTIQAACDKMWDGLYITKGSSLIIGPTSVEVPDTEVPAEQKTIITRSVFSDSYNGVVEWNSGGNGQGTPTSISYTDFLNNYRSYQGATAKTTIHHTKFYASPKKFKKPLDFEHNAFTNASGYFFAHSFIEVTGGYGVISSSYSNSFNGALYGMKLTPTNADVTRLGYIVNGNTVTPTTLFSTFDSCFVACIYTKGQNQVRTYSNRFVLPKTLNTKQIDEEKQSKELSPDAVYGIYAINSNISLENGGNSFTSPNASVPIGNLSEFTIWGHKYNHTAIYAENSKDVRLVYSNVFTWFKTGLHLVNTNNVANKYNLSGSRFTNCNTGIYIIGDTATSELYFRCNEFVKTPYTPVQGVSGSPHYPFIGLQLEGHFPIKSWGATSGTLPLNSFGQNYYPEQSSTQYATARVADDSPQGNELSSVVGSTAIPKPVPDNFIFIRNYRSDINDENLIPLQYYRFKNENINSATSEYANIIETQHYATNNSCYNTVNGVLNREGIEEALSVASAIELAQNSPNPFDFSTTVWYKVPAQLSENLELTVMDVISGKVLRRIPLTQATGTVEIRTDELASGMYIYTLTQQGKLLAKRKMVIVK